MLGFRAQNSCESALGVAFPPWGRLLWPMWVASSIPLKKLTGSGWWWQPPASMFWPIVLWPVGGELKKELQADVANYTLWGRRDGLK
jgi:hypothetical protein